jgi:hypothetical protein
MGNVIIPSCIQNMKNIYIICRNFSSKFLCYFSIFECNLLSENLRLINRVFILFFFVTLASSCSKDNNANLYEGTGLKSSIPAPGSYSYPAIYNPYAKPYSRAYSNPYQPAPYNYSPYYDYDQYYVAPTNYRNVEPNYGSGADTKY